MTEDKLLAIVGMLTAQGLTPLSAMILAALHSDIARDSRSFARIFGVAHALVLRESGMLAHDMGLLMAVQAGNGQRLRLALTPKGRAMVDNM